MNRLRTFFQSLRHAARGVTVVFRHEQSFRIQLVFAAIALAFSILSGISPFEYVVVLLLIGAVLSLEIINSVFERMIDSFKPRIHPIVRDIKDLMAATVLIVSVVSALVGFVIFWPHVRSWF